MKVKSFICYINAWGYSSLQDNYKDYDFENRLTVRVNNALKALKLNASVG